MDCCGVGDVGHADLLLRLPMACCCGPAAVGLPCGPATPPSDGGDVGDVWWRRVVAVAMPVCLFSVGPRRLVLVPQVARWAHVTDGHLLSRSRTHTHTLTLSHTRVLARTQHAHTLGSRHRRFLALFHTHTHTHTHTNVTNGALLSLSFSHAHSVLTKTCSRSRTLTKSHTQD